VQATGVLNEELTNQSSVTSSIAVPTPPTRRATLHLETKRGLFGIELGGIWSGATKKDETFQIAERSDTTYRILQDRIVASDALGVKGRVTLQKGRWNWYAQAARMGLVADGGPTSTITYTGWSLKDVGTGNQTNAMTGVAVNLGKFQLGPNFLWQKPIIGPIPGTVPSPGLPRNVLDDPFAVRANRETVGAELLIAYDPTPATWMWAWDNDVREDARLAASLDIVFRHHPTTQDAAIGILSDGTTTFAFPGAPPPRDLVELRGRLVSRVDADTRVAGTVYAATAQPNGVAEDGSARLIHRYGVDARIAHKTMAFATYLRFRDWGPFDYHRDFNLTFPVQVMGDLSHSLGAPRWFGRAQTRLGVRGTWRSLDRNSPRYSPATKLDAGGNPQIDLSVPAPNGREWEIRSYVNLAL
jgi:hypothetical protein